MSDAVKQEVSKNGKEKSAPFSLRSVYCRGGFQWMSDEFDLMVSGQQLFGQYKAAGRHLEIKEMVENIPGAKPIRSFQVTTSFEFRYLNANIDVLFKDPEIAPSEEEIQNKYVVARISSRITADYLIEVPENPPEEKLESWAAGNALLHCWPYWREFCHSTLLRMILPVTLMPMMIIEAKKD